MRTLIRRIHKLATIRGEFYKDVLETALEKLKPDEKAPDKKVPPVEVEAPTGGAPPVDESTQK